jgi:hypothetical protein
MAYFNNLNKEDIFEVAKVGVKLLSDILKKLNTEIKAH